MSQDLTQISVVSTVSYTENQRFVDFPRDWVTTHRLRTDFQLK